MEPESRPIDGPVKWRYNQRAFRPEAVAAYATRQAGEPWDTRHRFERWLLAGLTLVATAAITLIFLGVR